MRLLADPFRETVEAIVSNHLRRRWAAETARDMSETGAHPCAVLSDGTAAVFVKLSEAADGLEQFEAEGAGLRLLAERAGVRTPGVIGTAAVAGGAVLVLEAMRAVERGPREWREMGRALARTHAVAGERFGLERQNYFGPFRQDNRPLGDWPAFYAERRLGPFLRLAVDSGNVPAGVARQVERVMGRLGELGGPAVRPALVHGDAHSDNFISTGTGAVAIDPAAYWGHPEMDLAAIDFFRPAPGEVLEGYRETMPVDPGFGERRELWRLYGYLGCVTVDAGYAGRLAEAVGKYA